MIGNEDTIAWLAPHIAVVRYHGEAESVHIWGEFDESGGFYCSADDGEDIVAVACSPEYSFEICDVVVRLLAVSVVHSVRLTNRTTHIGASDGAVPKSEVFIVGQSRNG
jgi:hypothetical protein